MYIVHSDETATPWPNILYFYTTMKCPGAFCINIVQQPDFVFVFLFVFAVQEQLQSRRRSCICGHILWLFVFVFVIVFVFVFVFAVQEQHQSRSRSGICGDILWLFVVSLLQHMHGFCAHTLTHRPVSCAMMLRNNVHYSVHCTMNMIMRFDMQS